MASVHSSYSTPGEAKNAAKYLNEGAKIEAYNHLLPLFSQFIGECCDKGDIILRKVSPKREMNNCYQTLGYQLVGCKENYTTYEAQTVTKREYYVSGYSGRISSSGNVDISEDVSSHEVKHGEVRKTHEKKTAILERWVKIVPKGEREKYLKKEDSFLTVSRPYFQIRDLGPTTGKPSCLFALLHTLLMLLSIALPVFVSNFVDLFFSGADLFGFALLPHLIAAGCYGLSLVPYFVFIRPYRDKRVIIDIKDSKYFHLLWLSPVFFIVDAVLPIITAQLQNGWLFVGIALNWIVDLCGIVLLLFCLFYMVTLHHFRVLSHDHKLRQCFTEKGIVDTVERYLKALADINLVPTITKAADRAQLQLLDQFTKFSNFDCVVDPFCDDITGYAESNFDYMVLEQIPATVRAALAVIKKEAGDAPAPKKPRRTTKKKANAEAATAATEATATAATETTTAAVDKTAIPGINEATISAANNTLAQLKNNKSE